jgi:hypothetical protein
MGKMSELGFLELEDSDNFNPVTNFFEFAKVR